MDTLLDLPEVKVSAKPICKAFHVKQPGGQAHGHAITFWHRDGYIAVYAKGGTVTARIPEAVFPDCVHQYNLLGAMMAVNGQALHLNLK